MLYHRVQNKRGCFFLVDSPISPLALWSSLPMDSGIFFAEVFNSSMTFSPGQLCSYESSAAANPGRSVFVLVDKGSGVDAVPAYMY